MSRTSKLPTARLGVESLESRLTPAGNVAAFVESGTLFIQADRSSHTLEVQVYDDRLVLRALGSDTINGQRPPSGSASQTFFGDQNAIAAVVFDGNSGNDRLSVQSSFLTTDRDLDITARMYASGDHFGLGGGKLTGSVNVDLGSGYDSVVVSGDYSDVNFGIYLGAGNDTVRITGNVGTINVIDAAAGKDSLEIPAILYAVYSNVITGFETIKLT